MLPGSIVVVSTAMFLGFPRRFRHPSRLCGLLAVLVALVSQLALAGVVLPDESPQSQLAALDAASIFCQTGSGTGNDRPPAPHHAADYAICPLSVSLAQATAILAPDVLLPLPSHGRAMRPGALPQARAPPSRIVAAAYPRGPPSLA